MLVEPITTLPFVPSLDECECECEFYFYYYYYYNNHQSKINGQKWNFEPSISFY